MLLHEARLPAWSQYAIRRERDSPKHARFGARQGWINDVLECYFTKSLIGLFLVNAVNSVNVVDCNFEDNCTNRTHT